MGCCRLLTIGSWFCVVCWVTAVTWVWPTPGVVGYRAHTLGMNCAPYADATHAEAAATAIGLKWYMSGHTYPPGMEGNGNATFTETEK